MPLSGKRKAILPIRPSLLFESAVYCRPNAQAIFDVESKKEYTFSAVSRKANQLARLVTRKISESPAQPTSECPDRKGLLVAICMAPSSELIISLLAILKLEIAYVPLDVAFPSSRMEYIVKDSKPNVILTNGKVHNLEEAELDHVPVIDLADNWSQMEKEDTGTILLRSYEDDPLFAILYTSGSTGVPKGVKLGWRAVLNRTIWQWDTFAYNEDEVICFKTALTFVDSISEIFGALLSAHKLIIIPKRMTVEVEELIATLTEHKVQRLTLVPSLLRSILFSCSRSSNESLPHLRSWFCSGEPFPSDLLEEFFRIFPSDKKEICNIYGCTENLADFTYVSFKYENIKENSPKNVPIGLPIFNCDVYLVNNKMEEVPEQTIGEILSAGTGLCQGYVGVENSEKLIANPFSKEKGYAMLYKSGDYGRIESGILYYEGRKDSQIKIRGHRIDLMEVQNCLQTIAGVSRAHVLCHHPGQIDQMLVSFYTALEPTISVAEVISELERKLPIYMIPQVYEIKEMPLLINDKIDRQKLLEVYQNRNEGVQDSKKVVLEDCPNELKEVANILLLSIVKALGPSAPDCISLDNNYFKIGGNSLNVLLVLGSLQDVGYFIGLQDFVSAENFREILPKISLVNGKLTKYFETDEDSEEKYKMRPMNEEDIEEVIRIVVECFEVKSELEVEYGVTYKDLEDTYKEFIYKDFKNTLSKLSFLLCDWKTDEILGVSMNIDSSSCEVKYAISGPYGDIIQFIEDSQKIACTKMRGRKTMYSMILGTNLSVPERDNPGLVYAMESGNIKVAKQHNYDSILTANSSEITMQICQDLFDYEVLGIFQANLWVKSDGTRPFSNLRDNLKISVDVKYL